MEKILEDCLDKCDELTALRQQLSTAMSDGFLHMARERYSSVSTFSFMGKLTHDERVRSSRWRIVDNFDLVDLKECPCPVGVESGLRKRGGGQSTDRPQQVWEDDTGGLALRSTNVRSAEASFRKALEIAVELASKQAEIAEACSSAESVTI